MAHNRPRKRGDRIGQIAVDSIAYYEVVTWADEGFGHTWIKTTRSLKRARKWAAKAEAGEARRLAEVAAAEASLEGATKPVDGMAHSVYPARPGEATVDLTALPDGASLDAVDEPWSAFQARERERRAAAATQPVDGPSLVERVCPFCKGTGRGVHVVVDPTFEMPDITEATKPVDGDL